MMSFVNFETMRLRRVVWRRDRVLLWAALPAGMGFLMLLRRSGTPCCSIGLA